MHEYETVMAQAEQIAELKQQRDEYKKDAERYRWLRDKSEYGDAFYLSIPFEAPSDRYRLEEVDAAIDAAIAKVKP